MKLATTDTQHHTLWTAYHATRETSVDLKVPKAALYALLQDHAEMVGRLTKLGPVETKP